MDRNLTKEQWKRAYHSYRHMRWKYLKTLNRPIVFKRDVEDIDRINPLLGLNTPIVLYSNPTVTT